MTDTTDYAARALDLTSRARGSGLRGWLNRHRRRDLFAEARVYAILSTAVPLEPENGIDSKMFLKVVNEREMYRLTAEQWGAELKRMDATRSLMDAAMHSVWLHGSWRRLTKQMTTEQRNAAADAVERYHAVLDPTTTISATGLRWWDHLSPADAGVGSL